MKNSRYVVHDFLHKLSVFLFFLFITMLALGIGGCAEKDQIICTEKIPAADNRPSILIIGDSISIGYMEYIETALPAYQIVHNPCNAMNSRHTKANIDAWLDARPSWYAVTFNNALWDGADFARVYDDEYALNMAYISDAIKAKTARPLYILGTYVPVNTPYRSDGRQQNYNAIATNIMNNKSIPFVDLYTYSSANLHLYVNSAAQDDVHFEAAGSQALANLILTALNAEYGIN